MPSSVPIELYRSIERANASAKAAAAAAGPGAAFGVQRLTAAGLVEELWELWGDGRALVSPEERALLVGALMAEPGAGAALAASPGTVRLLAQFFARVGCLLDEPCEGSFTAREEAVIDLAERYRHRLGEENLIEREQAAALLAAAVSAGTMPRPVVCAVDDLRLDAGAEALLRAAGCESSEDAGALPFLPANIERGLVLAAGPSALAGLLLDEMRECLGAGDDAILVVTPDADGLFEALAAPLAGLGAAAALRCSRSFGETLVGRALAAVDRLGGPHLAEDAADLCYNRLSGAEAREAQRLNRAIRGDRCLAAAAVVEELQALSPTFGPLRAVAAALRGEGDGAAALDALAARIQEVDGLSPAERRREGAALDKVRGLLEAREQVGARGIDLFPLLEGATIPVQVLAGEGAARVEFASVDRLDSLVDASYDTVVVADLSQAAFPARAEATALDGLAEKLGFRRSSDEFAKERCRFAAAMGAARRRFTIALSERDAAGEETYPSFLVSEYADSLARAAADEDAEAWGCFDEDAFGLPEPLAACARRGGEEALARGLGRAFAPVTGAEEVPARGLGRLDQLDLVDFLRKVPEGDGSIIVLSPSAMEAYLACPYGWFLQKRIRPNPPDELLGPAEKGSFVHSVFARFYDGLAAEGVARVDADNLAECERRLDDVFDELLAEQCEEEPGSGRMVPRTKSEMVEVERLRGQLRSTLQRLASFAPAYRILGHELAIEPEDGIDYAGFRLNGRADRVEVNEGGARFAVIDYKGSTGREYAAGLKEGEEVSLPGRIQADVYAQALRARLEGLHGAGALYLSYSAKNRAGAFVGAADDTFDDNGFLSGASRVPLNFEAYLDAVEALAAEGLAGLPAGDIAPRPRSALSCRFCPAVGCERRLA